MGCWSPGRALCKSRSRGRPWRTRSAKCSTRHVKGDRDMTRMTKNVGGDRTPGVVVVVEDDADLRELYVTYLEGGGFSVAQAASGLEALRRIKAFDPSIRVVVVTGVDDPALPRQALALGASAVLQKPVEQEALLAALGEVSPSGSPVSDAQKTVATAPPTGPGLAGRVLVVDDEAEIRAVLEEYLLPKGYRVRSVADGAAALREVIDEAPDVILLDVDMPRLGGIEALTAIRGITRKVRVIMISGKASLETAKLALAYGAFDYI